jgi:hypothetical protein
VPLGKNEFPVFDDKDSFNLRISTAEIAIDSSNLANVLNSYVFARPHSPLAELSIIVEKGHLKVKGKLHDKGDIPFETEGTLGPTDDGKLRLHGEKIKAMHLPVKGLLDIFGIDMGRLIKEGKVPGVQAQEDDLILDLEQLLPPPHIEGKVVAVRMEGDTIVQIFGGPDAKPMKNMRAVNYMAYNKNRLRFGKLVMNDADLVLIDMDPMIHSISIWNITKNSFRRAIQKLRRAPACACIYKTIINFIPPKRLSATTRQSEVEVRNRSPFVSGLATADD